ncbi:hypothetical protein DCAR_0831372 [Daucus carota subsp. sativus]|uniref:Uncharacterized protein n=1 Tax=Daucus carota subsp. sativus TaxID=79200 RepID=A0AAF0XPH1_DAUCS|nr:hypothetical protein DCAR_0831372 [Daucus carota subsp. sativus]
MGSSIELFDEALKWSQHVVFFDGAIKCSYVLCGISMRWREAIRDVFDFPSASCSTCFFFFINLLNLFLPCKLTVNFPCSLKITYPCFYWKKGTPFSDSGIYNRLTWWKQRENGKQLTRNRKFLTVVM